MYTAQALLDCGHSEVVGHFTEVGPQEMSDRYCASCDRLVAVTSVVISRPIPPEELERMRADAEAE